MTWYDCHSFHLPQARTIRYDRSKTPQGSTSKRWQGRGPQRPTRTLPTMTWRWTVRWSTWKLLQQENTVKNLEVKNIKSASGNLKNCRFIVHQLLGSTHRPALLKPMESEDLGCADGCGWLCGWLSDPWSMVYDDLYGHPIIGIRTPYRIYNGDTDPLSRIDDHPLIWENRPCFGT